MASPTWTWGLLSAGSGSLSWSAAFPYACGPRRCSAGTTRPRCDTPPTSRSWHLGRIALLRHPGYGGLLLAWLGAGLATANWAVVLAIPVLMVVAYSYRIAIEEAMLLGAFGDRY
jgi:protein-S-isoprenylcysteine O-methyltransferase Ste14